LRDLRSGQFLPQGDRISLAADGLLGGPVHVVLGHRIGTERTRAGQEENKGQAK
jgi:hypothetical protein